MIGELSCSSAKKMSAVWYAFLVLCPENKVGSSYYAVNTASVTQTGFPTSPTQPFYINSRLCALLCPLARGSPAFPYLPLFLSLSTQTSRTFAAQRPWDDVRIDEAIPGEAKAGIRNDRKTGHRHVVALSVT